MAESSDLWYRLGYALERARHGAPARTLKGLAARRDEGARASDKVAKRARNVPEDEGASPFDVALAAGASTVIGKAIGLLPAHRDPGFGSLVRGAAAGALAAAVRMALEPVLDAAVSRGSDSGERGANDDAPPLVEPAERLAAGAAAVRMALEPVLDAALSRASGSGSQGADEDGDDAPPLVEPAERLAAGAARGALYSGLLEPRLPGPPLLRGLTYGTAEYLLGEWGGVRGVLGRFAPYRRLPVVGGLLDDAEGGEHGWVDHLAFGVALALLYDAGDRMGIGDDDT